MHERLKTLIETMTTPERRHKELEEKTNIASGTWKTYLTRGVRPSAELVEAIAQAWPQYAFWLVTGLEDADYGHTAPKFVIGVSLKESHAANAFFKALNRREKIEGTLDWRTSVRIEKSEDILREFKVVEETKKGLSKENWHVQVLWEIRWIEIFLEIYLPSLPVDEAISLYNFMRSRFKKLESEMVKPEEIELMTVMLEKFRKEKERIEQFIVWKDGK